MCMLYSSVKDEVYTTCMYYTTFREHLSKNLISIYYLSKKAITHYVVDCIYKYRSSRNIHIYPVQFFKRVISKVSTLLTSCIHSISSNWSEWRNLSPTASNYSDFQCIPHVCTTRKVMWKCINNDLCVKRSNGSLKLVALIHNDMIRKWKGHAYPWGDDYSQ